MADPRNEIDRILEVSRDRMRTANENRELLKVYADKIGLETPEWLTDKQVRRTLKIIEEEVAREATIAKERLEDQGVEEYRDEDYRA